MNGIQPDQLAQILENVIGVTASVQVDGSTAGAGQGVDVIEVTLGIQQAQTAGTASLPPHSDLQQAAEPRAREARLYRDDYLYTIARSRAKN